MTIAARNYLPRAAVLARSYRATHPDQQISILVVDAKPGDIPDGEDYRIATAEDLRLDLDEFRRMALIYDVTELCTSLKPWALEMLLASGADVATYLDPDIEVFDSLDELVSKALQHGVVLTPHTILPMPRDGLQPTEADIMHAGAFNLGYISVSKDARPMLEWWKQRLGRHSIFALDQALFVDQRWIDLVPGYFDHEIVRDPGYNVAYWNLHERQLTDEGDRILANGHPLRFFHFSGYSFERPWILNRYFFERPRALLSEHPVAHDLCARYRRQVDDAAHRLGHLVRDYGFDHLADGTPIVGGVRATYRNILISAEQLGDPLPPVPFVEEDSKLIAWLRSPAKEGSHVGRFLMGLWEFRADLRAAFPDPLGAHEQAFLDWAITATPDNEPELVACRNLCVAEPATLPHPLVEVPGLNVSGYFKAELGIGEAGRLLLDSVRASGLPVRTGLATQTLNRQNTNYDEATAAVRYPITVAAVNADQFPAWARTTGVDLLDDTYVIGQWSWELEDFPDYGGALDIVDEIWAISEFAKRAIQKTTAKPVYAFPFPVKERAGPFSLDRGPIGLAEEPYFLFVFDYLSVFERKNPLAVVAAFEAAFGEWAGPHLVIKAINGEHCAGDRERLRLACSHRGDIHLVESYLDGDELRGLMAEAMAYISLHRSEGLGLTMAEAMSYGTPVIATAYSGNLDFMTAGDSLLVPYVLISVAPGNDPYPTSAYWADPDIEVAASHLRWVAAHPAEAAALGEQGRQAILSQRGVDKAATFVRERVSRILTDRVVERARLAAARRQDGPVQAQIDRALELIHTAPDVASPSRLPRLAKRLRQSVYRVLTHHDERANDQLTNIVAAVSEVDRHFDARVEAIWGQVSDTRSEQSDTRIRVDSVAARFDDLGLELSQAVRHVSYLMQTASDASAHLNDIGDRLAATETAFEARLTTLDEKVQPIVTELAADHVSLEARLSTLDGRVQQIDAELVARPYTSVEDAGLFVDESGSMVMGYEPGADSLSSYAFFEDTFRGSESFIGTILKPYLPYLVGRGKVLDIGCGRGELLELLHSAGIECFGVDLDETMLARCREKGLDVRQADGIEVLEGTREGSLGAVTAIQVIEHLHPDDIRRLFDAAHRALRPDGALLAETVNPHSPPALKAFWLDLTHVRPLYPESLLSVAQQSGYDSARIVFPGGTGDLDRDLRISGSYAVLAFKAPELKCK